VSGRRKIELSETLKRELESFSEALKKEISAKRARARKVVMLKIARRLETHLGEKVYALFAETLFEVAKGLEHAYFERYVKSLYFSGDYRKFRQLQPAEVVRMMRYYFRKKDGTSKIPIEYAPLLLKLARNVKNSIQKTIKYRGKGSFIPEEAIFEELKKEYLEEKKCFSVKRRKKRQPKTGESEETDSSISELVSQFLKTVNSSEKT